MTKISNQYSLTNILTADLANSRLGINNVSPTVALDVTGAGKFSSSVTALSLDVISSSGAGTSIASGLARFITAATTIAISVGQFNSARKLDLYSYGISVTGEEFNVGTSTAHPLQFLTNATERMRITSAGNVGIGTSSPSTFLHVVGANTSNRGQLSIQSNNASNAALVTFYYDTTKVGGIGSTSSDFYGEAVNNYLFYAGGSERMRITSTGNVGIGTTSPTYKLDVAGTQRIGGISLPFLDFKTSDTVGAGYQYKQISYSDSTNAELYNIGYNYPNLQFLVAGTRVMTLTSGGNVLIGGTSTLGAGGTNLEISGGRAQLVVNSTTATASWFSVYPAGDGHTYILRNTGYSYLFGTATNQTTVGFVQQMSISSNGSIGAPSGTNIYNASDARLKKNISTTTYGLNAISALNPVKFNWVDGFEPTEDGKDMLGFIAQEVQSILPEAVESFGGNSVTIGDTIINNPLRVNEKFIIPVLVKAIQELSAKVSLLENK